MSSAFECSGERVPRKRGAVASRWEITHDAEHRQLSHVIVSPRLILIREQAHEVLMQRADALDSLPPYGLSHHRCGSHGDAATGALERGFANDIAVQVHIDREAVTA